MSNHYGPPDAEPHSEDGKPPGKFSTAWNRMSSSKAGVASKKGFDWGWQKMHPVGEWFNKKAGGWGIEGFWPVDIPRECEKCARILWTFAKTRADTFESASKDINSDKKTQKVVKQIPPEVIQRAEGLAIYTVWRMGIGVAGASGSGIVIARDSPTSWGAPSGILIHTLSWGFLAGTDVYDVVLVLRSKKAVEAFCKPKISIGSEVAAVAGPHGTGAALSMGVEAAPVFSYVKSKGLYGGIQLDGNVIIARDDENERFYGHRVKAADILTGGHVAIPKGAESLLTVIDAAEGKEYDSTLLPDYVDVAPSDMPASGQIAAKDAQHADASARAATGTTGTPPLPVRRNVPPPLPPVNHEDPQEQIVHHLPPTGGPPPRPPRRFVNQNSPGGSPRVSSESPRVSGEHRRVGSEAAPSSLGGSPMFDEKVL